jgi:hypothetical protein
LRSLISRSRRTSWEHGIAGEVSLRALAEDFVKVLPAGQYVKHGVYGFGTITVADAERTTIDFDEHGVKKFVTSLMVCELAGDVPPRPSRSNRRKKSAVTAGSRVSPASK